MILICGDSGSGKTCLSRKFGVPVLECDRYHKWERGDYHWKYYTHLNPAANEINLMINHVNKLKAGEKIEFRDYNHSSGVFSNAEVLPTGDFVVCGLHAFACDGIKIFVDTDHDLKSLWKINRDFMERGHSIRSILDKIDQRKSDYENYILPQMKQADYIVRHNWTIGVGLTTQVYESEALTDMTESDLIEKVKSENRNL